MIVLSGKNLGERHRELNTKVKEAAAQNVDLEQIKQTAEHTDLDKLFKIDLASKYMNIEYIIDVLKSGDSLHISRALKCKWVYDDEFSTVINPENLHNNVFPAMSAKMKNKLLVAIAANVRKPERAIAFYKYCDEAKLSSIALKFLIFTSDEFKLEFLKQVDFAHKIYEAEGYYSKYFIGTSFTLMEAFVTSLQATSERTTNVFIDLSYLYTVSDTRFLDLLDNFGVPSRRGRKFGARISKNILTKHKYRVLAKPQLYVLILNQFVLIKHSTSDNAKQYLEALLPDDVTEFWNRDFCKNYQHIVDIIPQNERFEFIKRIFNENYPNEEFEMNKEFHSAKYFMLMTTEEKETWALRHIDSKAEMLGIGRDFLWYKYVNFDKAFEEIKKLIIVTPDKTKRAELMKVVLESAKTQCDLEKLFEYYYARHVNEPKYIKSNYIDKVLLYHKVYQFDQECWAAFNKILHSMDVYSMTDHISEGTYKVVVLIYSIINKKELHEAIKLYINTNVYFYSLRLKTQELPKEHEEMVYQYLFKYYVDKISEFDNQPYGDGIKNQVNKQVNFFLGLLEQYDKTKEDIPEIVYKYIKLDWDEFKYHNLLRERQVINKTTQEDLIRLLKKDAKLVADNLPEVEKYIETEFIFRISKLLKKIKIYFPNDVTKDYLNFFVKLLDRKIIPLRVATGAIHGIFQLADNDFKAEIMVKYAPAEPKIIHATRSDTLLNIQKAICAHALYSRPSIPLTNMLLYIKGDYVQFCMPLFNSYLANLPLPLCIEFIESILNTPVSIQKHGLRLAFACFSPENLKTTVMNIWKRTKNISLRFIMYKAIFDKVVVEESSQEQLFETLLSLTLEIHQEDDEEIFSLLTSYKMPKNLLPEYINTSWIAINKLQKRASNLEHLERMIRFIQNNIEVVSTDLQTSIIEEFIKSISASNDEQTVGDKNLKQVTVKLYREKWDFTAKYITYVVNKDNIANKLKLVVEVLDCIVALGDKMNDNKQFTRTFSIKFLDNLECTSYYHEVEYYENINSLFEGILQAVEKRFSLEEIYSIIWRLRLGLIARKVIFKGKKLLNDAPGEIERHAIVRNMCFDFGQALGDIIKECVNKNVYYASFFDVIKEEVISKIINIKLSVNKNGTEAYDFNEEDLGIAVSNNLLKFKMTETYLFAFELTPSNYSLPMVFKEDYNFVLDELRKVDNNEISCNVYHKFVDSSCKGNWFMESMS